MEKQINTIIRIQIVVGILFEILLEERVNIYIVSWLLSDLCCLWSIKFTLLLYSDMKNIYPPEKLCKPSRFQKIFKKIYGSEKIPKSFIRNGYFVFIIFIVATSSFCIMLINQTKKFVLETALIFALIVILEFIYVYYVTYMVIFVERFKKVNKSNICYALILSNNRTTKWPVSKVIGKCNVIEYSKKKRKTYATVMMIDSGEIFENVLCISEIKKIDKKSYKLHEICNEYYITL